MTDIRHRSWAFTKFDYDDAYEKMLQDLQKTYLVYGREICKETQRKHLQGSITFKNKGSFKSINKILNCHIEPVIDLVSSRNYCMKENNYYLEDNTNQGKRTDLDRVVQIIKDKPKKSEVIEQCPVEYIKFHSGIEKLISHYQKERNFKPEVTWIYGATQLGKTRYVYEREPDLWMSQKNLKWWLDYENQEATCFDDFRGDFCTYHELLRILDRYPYSVEIKGGSRKLNSQRMYITSPFHPKDIYDTIEDKKQLLRRIDKIIFFYIDNNGLHKTKDVSQENVQETEQERDVEGDYCSKTC